MGQRLCFGINVVLCESMDSSLLMKWVTLMVHTKVTCIPVFFFTKDSQSLSEAGSV